MYLIMSRFIAIWNGSFYSEIDQLQKCMLSIYILLSIFLVEEVKEFEDTKRVIRGRKSKDWQHNGQIKIDKKANNDTQHTTRLFPEGKQCLLH
jgi:hypothetical protein